MLALAVMCALGLPAGFVLLWRIPRCNLADAGVMPDVSLIVPARNEERNLPQLLSSLTAARLSPAEAIVVDDSSQDSTAEIAGGYGARVLQGKALPPGWTGKTWACWQGAQVAHADSLLFVDADTWFEPGGFDRAVSFFRSHADGNTAVSLVPFHVTHAWYEELSLFFNLLMTFGAGGFGLLGKPRLFGQSLLISRELYERSGGHAAVRSAILENFELSSRVVRAGGHCVCVAGRGVLNVRMFPDGFAQLREGWIKAFAQGAAESDGRVLAVSIYWLSALSSTFFGALFLHGSARGLFLLLYAAFAFQVYAFARQIGTFRWVSCVLYPVPLVFFFGLFTQSLIRRALKQKVTWRGREL